MKITVNNKKIIMFFSIPAVIAILILSGLLYLNMRHPTVDYVFCGIEGAKYNDSLLLLSDFYSDLNEFKYLGREKDRESNSLYSVTENGVPVLLTAVGSDNTYCYINPDYEIPVSGEITKIFVDPAVRSDNEKRLLTSSEDIEKVKRIIELKNHNKELYRIENYYMKINTFYFAYNNCPVSVSENFGGIIAYTEGKYIYISPENDENKISITSASVRNTYEVYGVEITDADILKWLPHSIITNSIEQFE